MIVNAFVNSTRNMTQLQEIYGRNHTRKTIRISNIIQHLPYSQRAIDVDTPQGKGQW